MVQESVHGIQDGSASGFHLDHAKHASPSALVCAATELLVQGNPPNPLLIMEIIPWGAAAELPSPTACSTSQAQGIIHC
jgi:hypothetical protein